MIYNQLIQEKSFMMMSDDKINNQIIITESFQKILLSKSILHDIASKMEINRDLNNLLMLRVEGF